MKLISILALLLSGGVCFAQDDIVQSYILAREDAFTNKTSDLTAITKTLWNTKDASFAMSGWLPLVEKENPKVKWFLYWVTATQIKEAMTSTAVSSMTAAVKSETIKTGNTTKLLPEFLADNKLIMAVLVVGASK